MLKAVILDDETRAAALLKHKLKAFAEELCVTAIFDDPYKALDGVTEQAPDVLFLDVDMPGLNGLQFLEQLGHFKFQVIFTTAYEGFVLEALRLNAVDYLVKPIDQEQLHAAIGRLQKRVANQSSSVSVATQEPLSANLALSTAEGIYFVKKSSIVRIEAMSNYSVFFLQEKKKIIVSKTLKEYEGVLAGFPFFRINRSVIVNLEYAVKYKRGDGGILEMTDGIEIEISASRKNDLLKLMSADPHH